MLRASRQRRRDAASAVRKAAVSIIRDRRRYRTGRFIGPVRPQSISKPGMVNFNRPELKVIEEFYSSADITTSSVTLLNGCAVGTANYERIGSKIKMKSLRLRIAVTPITATTVNNFITYYLVYDRQTNGTSPTTSNYLTLSAITDPFLGFPSLSNQNRFKTIKSWRLIIPLFGCDAPETIDEYIDLSKVLGSESGTMYINTGDTSASVGYGGLYLFSCPSNQGAFASAANYCKETFASRIMFADD